MKTVRRLMNAGDFAAAAERLRARLAISPGDEEAKLMLGTCLHLLGDDESFMRIDDELSKSPTAQTLPAWPKFHALRAAACGGALLLAGVLCDLQAAEVPQMLYAGPPIDARQLVVPRPKASDGNYSGYVRLTWKSVDGAAFYKVRRATSRNFGKSKVIATVTGTTYKDLQPARRPRKKYYYWIVPYVEAGQGKKDAAKSDSGYAKQILKIGPSGVMEVGGVWKFTVSGNKGQGLKRSDCEWRIVSGADCAKLTRSGKLTAKKEGTVVVSATYNGTTAKATVQIVSFLYTLYGGPPSPVLTKYGGPPVVSLEKASSRRAEMTVLPPERLQ
ncbi:MAG: hypothetical protein IJG84_03225 [Kiritimatiellae bacterium]|nr:hypothetical protein [Kiritimatiellia bacterium]